MEQGQFFVVLRVTTSQEGYGGTVGYGASTQIFNFSGFSSKTAAEKSKDEMVKQFTRSYFDSSRSAHINLPVTKVYVSGYVGSLVDD